MYIICNNINILAEATYDCAKMWHSHELKQFATIV
jgi:hypothetical protein